MKPYHSILTVFLIFPLLLLFQPSSAYAEWRGNIALENRYFLQEGLYSGQKDNYLSLSFAPEYVRTFDDSGNIFAFKPYIQIDQYDEERTHVDIRELNMYLPKGDWEWRVGISSVFWGKTESQHLVDIINQTDFVDNIDGEDKLGQPMVHVSWTRDWGILDFFLLPGFRERTFPGENGRLRSGLIVDTEHPVYESDQEAAHIDGAIRWSHFLGDWDLGLHYFNGTSRDPVLMPQMRDGQLRLTPHYYLIEQVGIDAQATLDAWLWKLEMIQRWGQPEDYFAWVGGFEYSFFSVAETSADLGVLAEYHSDSRDDELASQFQNDLFVGARLGLNDVQSTELLAGGFFDLDYGSRVFRLEASRRLGQHWKLTGEMQLFDRIDQRDLSYALRDDDFVMLALARYF